MNPELEKIRKVEIRNIIAKLQAGKTLTGPERKQVDEYYATQGTVKQTEVAAVLGLSKMAISKHVKNGMPLTSMEAALEWYKNHVGNPQGGVAKLSLHDVKVRLHLLDIDKRQIQIDRMKGEQLHRESCLLIWTGKLRRLSETIRGIDYLQKETKQKLCAQLRSEIERLPDELAECRFEEAAELEQESEEDDEEYEQRY